MTAKFDKFTSALDALCREHEVMICASMYDSLQVWDAAGADNPVNYSGVEDKTAPPEQQSPTVKLSPDRGCAKCDEAAEAARHAELRDSLGR